MGTITIPGHQLEFVELPVLQVRAHTLKLSASVPSSLLGGTDVVPTDGCHRWELYVGADGVKPITTVIEFVVDGPDFISRATLGEAPEEFVDRRLLRLLAGAQEAEPVDQAALELEATERVERRPSKD